MVHLIKGDLFSSGADIIAHGVNCRGRFGSGIAGIISKQYPHVRAEYLEHYEWSEWKLGDVQMVVAEDGLMIANCATQDMYGYDGQLYADYDAIRICMGKVKEYARNRSNRIAIPKIGCGLAGGDWGIVKGILDEVFQDYDVSVYYLE
jgi:O-acetyl-ADP-ribose deacetylase (regulator of RNase III)